jgi:hypothetical protein
MKDDALLEYADTPRLALWTGLAIALGIILHRIFFLLAAVIALIAPMQKLLEWLRQHHQPAALQSRHN